MHERRLNILSVLMRRAGLGPPSRVRAARTTRGRGGAA